jgi:hypothetical protein
MGSRDCTQDHERLRNIASDWTQRLISTEKYRVQFSNHFLQPYQYFHGRRSQFIKFQYTSSHQATTMVFHTVSNSLLINQLNILCCMLLVKVIDSGS